MPALRFVGFRFVLHSCFTEGKYYYLDLTFSPGHMVRRQFYTQGLTPDSQYLGYES